MMRNSSRPPSQRRRMAMADREWRSFKAVRGPYLTNGGSFEVA